MRPKAKSCKTNNTRNTLKILDDHGARNALKIRGTHARKSKVSAGQRAQHGHYLRPRLATAKY
jgi:hypothetical protein